MSVLNYVSYLPLCRTYNLRALRALPCLKCLVPYKSTCLTCLVPCFLSCLPYFVPYLLSCLTCLMPYVLSCLMGFTHFHVLSCCTCIVPLVFLCSSCFVLFVLFCSSSLSCFRCFKHNIPHIYLMPCSFHVLQPSSLMWLLCFWGLSHLTFNQFDMPFLIKECHYNGFSNK